MVNISQKNYESSLKIKIIFVDSQTSVILDVNLFYY